VLPPLFPILTVAFGVGYEELGWLFTTGYAKDAIVHKGTVDEGIHLIGKPWSIAALGQKIREVLEQEPEAA
jgi:hypothetical protein